MKRLLSGAILVLLAVSFVQAQGDLERSDKMTLFVYPVQYGKHAQNVTHNRKEWTQKEFYEIFVLTFQRFDFITLPESTNLSEFVTDASGYMDSHAKEMVQKRNEEDGRIGETLVTLDDLKNTIQNSYLFVPKFNRVKQEKDDDGNTYFEMEIEMEVYRVIDGEKLTTLHVGAGSVGTLFGTIMNITANAVSDVESVYQNTVSGYFEELKTSIRKMDEFSLKALVTMSNYNSFHFDLGKDFGVRLDGRYKVWRLNAEGERVRMLAFGKVRDIEENSSRAQILIGGATWGDQVVEAAAIGLNIVPIVGAIPMELKGFDQFADGAHYRLPDGNDYGAVVWALPEDSKGYRASIGISLEYNTAWITGISELYLMAEGSWVPVSNMFVYNGNIGLEKKYYFRRFGLFGIVKLGVLGIDFMETEIKGDDYVDASDASVIGIGGDLGAEVILTPNVSLQGRLGWYGFPEQHVISAISFNDGELHHASVRSVGLTYKVAVLITL